MIRLNLGCGKVPKKGYINVDLNAFPGVDKVMDCKDLKDFPNDYADLIEADHLLEHFELNDVKTALKEWHRVLKPGGILGLEIPDIVKCARNFVNDKGNLRWKYWALTIYGAQRYPGDTHRSGFDFDRLKQFLEEAGFRNVENISPTREDIEHNLRVRCTKT